MTYAAIERRVGAGVAMAVAVAVLGRGGDLGRVAPPPPPRHLGRLKARCARVMKITTAVLFSSPALIGSLGRSGPRV